MDPDDLAEAPLVRAEDPAAPRLGRTLMLAAVLCVVTLWAYRRSFAAPFIFDDLQWILEDARIRSLWPLGSLVGNTARPVWFLSLALNFAWGGYDPRGYHLVNFLIHLAAGLVLFGIVRRSARLAPGAWSAEPGASWLGFVVALLWMVHPLQTESVTYVVQRCESLMGLCYLLAVYCLLRGATATHAWPWYLGVVAASSVGMGTKEVMATAPVVLLLYDRAFLASSWRAVFRSRWWVYAGLLPAWIWLGFQLRPSFDAEVAATAGFGVQGVTWWEYLRSQGGVILYYLRLCFWPVPLCLDYQWPVAEDAWAIYLPGSVILSLLLVTLVAWRFWPRLSFLGCWFFLILAPTSSVVPIADLAFEHRMYLPLAAVSVLVVLVCQALLRRLFRDDHARGIVGVAGLTIVSMLLILTTIQRNADYRDLVRMWQKTLAVAPHNHRAHFNLGRAYGQRGMIDKEREHYQQALQLNPRYAKAHGNLGVLLAQAGQDEEAIRHYRQAIQLKPDYLLAYVNFANLLARQGQYERAEALYRRALEVGPGDARALQNLGQTLQKQGRTAAAISVYRQAVRARPQSVPARLALAWLLATAEQPELRQGAEAVALAEAARQQLASPDCRVWDVLAAAYAEVGRFDAARQAATQAAELVSEAEEETELPAIEARLALYAKGQPYRESAAALAEK